MIQIMLDAICFPMANWLYDSPIGFLILYPSPGAVGMAWWGICHHHHPFELWVIEWLILNTTTCANWPEALCPWDKGHFWMGIFMVQSSSILLMASILTPLSTWKRVKFPYVLARGTLSSKPVLKMNSCHDPALFTCSNSSFSMQGLSHSIILLNARTHI